MALDQSSAAGQCPCFHTDLPDFVGKPKLSPKEDKASFCQPAKVSHEPMC